MAELSDPPNSSYDSSGHLRARIHSVFRLHTLDGWKSACCIVFFGYTETKVTFVLKERVTREQTSVKWLLEQK